MIFVRTEKGMHAVYGVIPGRGNRFGEAGPIFCCINSRAQRCYIYSNKTECVFYKGPVAELLSLIFPKVNPALYPQKGTPGFHKSDILRAVPVRLWASE